MGKEIVLSIDNHEVRTQEGTSVLEAAQKVGIYIPRLCFHPDLPPGPGTKAETQIYRSGEPVTNISSDGQVYDGCNICIVGIEGKGFTLSCSTFVEDGMVIHTDTAEVMELRRDHLTRIISLHPHACILCGQKSGCDREECSQGVERDCRCCPKFDICEFQKISKYIIIKEDVPRYIFKKLPKEDANFFTIDRNLCIGCTRCVRACEKMQGKKAVGFVHHDGAFILGTLGPSFKESGCVFCGACVAVCPTGALRDKGLPWKKKEKLNFTPIVFPPEESLEFTMENLAKVPEANGVYQLLDESKEVIWIKGTPNLLQDLRDKLKSIEKARFFRYEEHGMYTMVESQMLARFLKENGKLPELNDELSDLY